MTGIEIVLLFIGVIFMVGSFMVTEKLSTSEVNKISELSESEIDKIMEHSLQKADGRIEEAIDSQIQDSIEKVDRALEKETNEKIMAISEYSDTVVEAMNKTHNEIMFLYSMLNDKHTDLTNLAAKLQGMLNDGKQLEEELAMRLARQPQPQTAAADSGKRIPEVKAVNVPQPKPEDVPQPEKENLGAEAKQSEPDWNENSESEQENHNMDILRLHKEGYSNVQIAQKLDVGMGEVQLVIGLFEGEGK